MPWSPINPNLKFGLEVLDNVHGYFETNANDAVTWANGGSPLDPYVRILKQARVSTEYPSLAIVEARQLPDIGEELASYTLIQEFLIETIVAGRAPGALLTELRKRVAANWQTVLSVPADVWLAGLLGTASTPIIELNQAVYSGVRDPKTSGGLYTQTALQSFTIAFTQAD